MVRNWNIVFRIAGELFSKLRGKCKVETKGSAEVLEFVMLGLIGVMIVYRLEKLKIDWMSEKTAQLLT